MFTKRYIALPIEMYNRKTAELTGDEDSTCFEAVGKFNPFDISGYWPAYDNDGNPEDKTTVSFKNGESVLVLLSLTALEVKLNEFMAD